MNSALETSWPVFVPLSFKNCRIKNEICLRLWTEPWLVNAYISFSVYITIETWNYLQNGLPKWLMVKNPPASAGETGDVG